MPTIRPRSWVRRATLIAAWVSVLATVIVLIVVPSPSIRIPLVTVLITVLMALASLWFTTADS